MSDPLAEVTEDRLLGGAVRLLQLRRGHRAGTDAVLLAGLVEATPGDIVADLGAATGAVGLMVAARQPDVRILLVEREPVLAAIADRNVVLNGLGERARVILADLFAPKSARREAGLEAGMVDLVLTNPPFFEGVTRPSPEPGRRSAHVMEGGKLAEWLAAAANLLRHRGRLALIYRADGLARCLAALGRHFGSVLLTPIYPREGEPATRIVVQAVKGGRAPLRIAPALILHAPGGGFTAAAERLHGPPA
ncbi:tRNA1(Val) (adenine(37)-N6)-methyltransferase [Enterovirga aerilata]|uniref:Methyltransferase n=1 Tax=Enterovirga aerilata TaxID=2730920 RepID=A0A849IEQ2_9HYPH|nr:methyltransferase [Enterovirga sp. DB1703]NNM74570.1 methyltransferase [Enterovirga sp. DB1703]